MPAIGRRRADRWLYWWNLGYRDGLTGAGRNRRVPSLYRHSYRYGLRQGSVQSGTASLDAKRPQAVTSRA